MTTETISGWAIVELMGHRERPGAVSEVEIAGGKFLRIDIPADGGEVTEYYGATSIYSIRPVSEEIARDRAKRFQARPPRPVEYAAALPAPDDRDHDLDDDIDF